MNALEDAEWWLKSDECLSDSYFVSSHINTDINEGNELPYRKNLIHRIALRKVANLHISLRTFTSFIGAAAYLYVGDAAEGPVALAAYRRGATSLRPH